LKSFFSIRQIRLFGNIWGIEALVEDIDNPVGAGAGVDHENALAGLGILFIDDDDAGGDAGAVEQVGGEADDALDVAFADEIAADFGFGVAAKEDAVREDACAFAGGFEGNG